MLSLKWKSVVGYNMINKFYIQNEFLSILINYVWKMNKIRCVPLLFYNYKTKKKMKI